MTSSDEHLLAALTALKDGKLDYRLPEDNPEINKEIAVTFNTFIQQMDKLTSEVKRLATELGNEGMLGGQAEIEGLSGAWAETRDAMNQMEGSLTGELRRVIMMLEMMTNEGRVRPRAQHQRNEIWHLGGSVALVARQIAELTQE